MEIDSLEVKISAQVTKASASITNLSKKLDKLSASLSGVNSRGLATLGAGVNKLSNAMENFSKNTKTSDFTRLAKNLEAISKIDMSNISNASSQIATFSKEVDKVADLAKVTSQLKDFAKEGNKEIKAKVTFDTSKYEEAIGELSGKFSDAGKNIQFSGNLSSLEKQYKKLSANLDKLSEKENKIMSVGEISPFSKTFKDLQYEISSVINQMDTLSEKIKSLESLRQETKISGIGENSKTLNDYENELQDFKNEMKTLGDVYNNFQNIKIGGLDTPIEDLKKTISELKLEYPQATNVIKEYENELQMLQNISNSLTKEPQVNLAPIGNEADSAKNKIAELAEKLNQLIIPPIDETNLTKLQSDLTKTEAEWEKLQAKLTNEITMGMITESVDDSSFVKLQEQIKLTELRIEALKEKIQEIEQTSTMRWTEKLGQSMTKIADFAKKAQTSIAGISNALGKINGAINNVIGKFSNLAKSIAKTGENSKKTNLTFSSGFKTILRYGFGIRSLYFLFNKLRNAIKEGMGNLTEYSAETNASVGMLKNSLNQLKNAAAAAISPILNAIAPALNTLIQLFVSAANAVNQFFSALLGNGTWIKAKTLTDAYSDSISGAAKEAKAGIRAFDELNVIGSQDNSGGSSGATSGADMFDTVAVESKFKEFAEKVKDILSQLFAPLREAWENEEKFVISSWKYALEEIWELIKDIGKDFLEVWQQEETVKIFEDIFHILGDIGLVVGNLAKNFREAWNESKTGKKILENIRDIIGVVVSNIRHAADETVKWSKNLDFSPLLSKIEKWTASLVPVFDSLSGIVTDFYEQVLLPLGKWVLEKGLPDLLQVFIDFNDSVDWEALRKNLSEFWKHLEPFAETVGEGLILFIGKVSKLLADFLNSETFVNFLEELEEWMDNVTPEDVANGIEKLAKAFIAFKLAMAAFKVGGAIAQSLTFLLDNLTALKAMGTVALVVTVAIVGFEAGKEIGKMLNPEDTELYDSFKFFGEGGFFGTLKEDLKSDLDGMLDMITDFENDPAIAGIGSVVAGPLVTTIALAKKSAEIVVTEAKEKWEELKENSSKTWENISETASEKWNALKENASTAFGDVKTSVSTAWENAKTNTSEKWSGIKTNLSETWETLKTNATEKFENIKSNVSEKWESLKTNTSEKWSGIKTNLSETWDKLKENASDKFGKIKENVTDAWEELKKNTSETWDGIKEAIKTPINGIIGFINKMISGIVSGINSMTSALNSISFKIPDEVPVVGGLGFDLNIPQITAPQIPMLAKGGLVYQATYLQAGEAGAEAILPLTDAKAMSMIADSIVSNMDYNTNVGSTGLDEQKLYNIVYNAVGSAITNNRRLESMDNHIQAGKTINLDSGKVAESTKKHADEYFKRTGNPYFAF